MSHTPIIETSGLAIGYTQKGRKPKVIHDSLQLQLYAGKPTGLPVLNGTGKSTLLRTICGFQPALDGNIRKGRPMICDSPEDPILSGAFETFFDKEGITFDSSTGKLTADKPSCPITVEKEISRQSIGLEML
jgi:ABC-type transporter Mla maintaining outer membrane lipid asymmetry ATPase subunit MlaF